MIHLLASNGVYAPSVVAEYGTFAEAVSAAHDLFNIVCIAVDEDHEDCADFITMVGSLYMIEPADRRASREG